MVGNGTIANNEIAPDLRKRERGTEREMGKVRAQELIMVARESLDLEGEMMNGRATVGATHDMRTRGRDRCETFLTNSRTLLLLERGYQRRW